MSYDDWKTSSPDDDMGDSEPPSREQEEADYLDELQQKLELEDAKPIRADRVGI